MELAKGGKFGGGCGVGLGEPPLAVCALKVFLNVRGRVGYVVGSDVEGGEDVPCVIPPREF